MCIDNLARIQPSYYVGMFIISPEHFYLYITIPLVVIWAALYLVNKETRREQKILSLIGAVIGPFSEGFFSREFWLPHGILPIHLGHRTFLLEDMLFGAAIVGIAAVIFEVMFRTHQRKFKQSSKKIYEPPHMLLIFIAAFFLALSFGFNSIYASAFAFLATAVPLIFFRRDLFLNALFSGIAVLLILFGSYFVIFSLAVNIGSLMKGAWLIYGTALGSTVVGIPITQLIWGFSMGFLAGPLYEFVKGFRISKR